MNIVVRTKNNLEYAKCRRRRQKAYKEMLKHINDIDDSEYKKWARIHFENTRRCIEIPLY